MIPTGTYVLHFMYVYLHTVFVRTTPIFRADHTYISSGPHLFRPGMMFSYFTPKVQLLGDSALGLLGSTTEI